MPEFQDRCVVCLDCGETFIWTAGEQLFYAEKGLTYPPKRCKPCKQRRNTRLTATACSQARHDADERVEAKVLCAHCGVPTTVPFQPTQGRPVYCRPCFERQRAAAQTNATTSGK